METLTRKILKLALSENERDIEICTNVLDKAEINFTGARDDLDHARAVREAILKDLKLPGGEPEKQEAPEPAIPTGADYPSSPDQFIENDARSEEFRANFEAAYQAAAEEGTVSDLTMEEVGRRLAIIEDALSIVAAPMSVEEFAAQCHARSS